MGRRLGLCEVVCIGRVLQQCACGVWCDGRQCFLTRRDVLTQHVAPGEWFSDSAGGPSVRPTGPGPVASDNPNWEWCHSPCSARLALCPTGHGHMSGR